MGTLRKLKTKMRMDRDWHKALVRSAKDEILIDVDGDKEADVALLDTTGDGDIDTLAVDLTGDGEFNLYFVDSDRNAVPDIVFLDEDGTGNLRLLGIGAEVEEAMTATARAIYAAILADEYISSAWEEALDALEDEVKQARKALKKRR